MEEEVGLRQIRNKSPITVSKYKEPKLKAKQITQKNQQSFNRKNIPRLKSRKQSDKQQQQSQDDISQISKRELSISNFKLESTDEFPTGLLGKGTFGEVMLMRSLECNQLFAMKILRKKELFQHDLIKNLKQEIRIQKQMINENIVKLYNYFEDHENVYLILEFCKYGNLQEYIRKCKTKLSEKEIYTIFVQVCRGIQCLHSNGIIHRDLKPENILINENFLLKVSDFGLSTENSVLKQSFVGTMAYMSPEMLSMGDKTYTSKIDLWGLGIVLYQLIYGEREFFAQSQNIQHGKFLSSFSYSQDLFYLLISLLQVSPESRISLEQLFQSPWMQRMGQQQSGISQNISKEFKQKKKENKENHNNSSSGSVWDSMMSLLGCGAPRKRQ